MKRQINARDLIGLFFVALFISGCGFSSLISSPTATPYPTYTPYPTPTPIPQEVIYDAGEWVVGHFFSIKVVDVRNATNLDGQRPIEDTFVIVEVDWKGNNLDEGHRIEGIDFTLVDNTDKQYAIVGMIYESDTFDTFGSKAEFQKGKWRISRISGTKSDTYLLVYDVPASATGFKMWYRNFPKIDLGL